MNVRSSAVVLGLLAVLASTCGKTVTATEIMVIVDAEPGVRAQAERLHVVVSGGSASATEHGAYDRTFSLHAGDLEWPHLTALAPSKDDAGRVYEFTASALDTDGNAVAQVRAVSGYVAHQRLALRLLLEDSCLGKACGTGLTCKKAECTSAKVDQATLLPFTEADAKGAALDGGAAIDGGARPPPRGHDGGMSDSTSDAGGGAGSTGGSGGGAGSGGVGGSGGSGGAGGSSGTNGAAGAGGSSACSGTNVCTADYPCEELVCPPSNAQCQDLGAAAPDYTCRGQFADWTPSDSPSTFTVNGDGTVTDSRNGLVWQQAPRGSGTAGSPGFGWETAKVSCASAALPGAGWRLPTKAELESIVDFSISNPSVDVATFPAVSVGFYWSSSVALVPGALSAWGVDFGAGYSTTAPATQSRGVWCVRSAGPTFPSTGSGATPPGRYTDNLDGSVYDSRTKLTWQQSIDGNTYTQAAAVSYCTKLVLAGSGWKLPSVSQLLTLVSPTRSNPAIDSTIFPSAPAEKAWSSTAYVGGSGAAWTVDLAAGYSQTFGTSTKCRVLCVR